MKNKYSELSDQDKKVLESFGVDVSDNSDQRPTFICNRKHSTARVCKEPLIPPILTEREQLIAQLKSMSRPKRYLFATAELT